MLPLLGAEGPQKCCRKRAVYEKFENLKNFEKFLLKNAIKLILGDFLKKIFLNFFDKIMKKDFNNMEINIPTTTPYHPQWNGQCERLSGEPSDYFCVYID